MSVCIKYVSYSIKRIFVVFHCFLIKSLHKLKFYAYFIFLSQQMFRDIQVTGYEGKQAVTSVNTLISRVDTDGLS